MDSIAVERSRLPSSGAVTAAAKMPIPAFAFHAALLALCGTHFLLPTERGFPLVRIMGLPCTATLLATVCSLTVLTITHPRGVLHALYSEYVGWQMAFLAWSAVSCVVNQSPADAWAPIIQYAITFVGNFLVLAPIINSGRVRLVAGYIAFFAIIATVPGIFEGLLHSPLGPYDNWSQDFRQRMGYDLWDTGGRVSGTLGNPIVYATALLVAVPWVLERRGVLRWPAAMLLLVVSALSVSRTWFLLAVPLGLGFFFTMKRRFLWFVVSFALIVPVSFAAFQWMAPDFYSTWVDRLENRDQAAGENVQMRLDAVSAVIEQYGRSPPSVLIAGNGTKSAGAFAERAISFGTLDNSYANLLYEVGLVGLSLYLVAWTLLLVRVRNTRGMVMHVFGVIGMLLSGLSFVCYSYATANLSVVASAAFLTASASDSRRINRKGSQ